MHILHGTWISDDAADFVQRGNFYLWVETAEKLKSRKVAMEGKQRKNQQKWKLREIISKFTKKVLVCCQAVCASETCKNDGDRSLRPVIKGWMGLYGRCHPSNPTKEKHSH